LWRLMDLQQPISADLGGDLSAEHAKLMVLRKAAVGPCSASELALVTRPPKVVSKTSAREKH
jgi:hypothetical protein